MRVLFDQGTPEPLRRSLAGHQVSTAYERGWSRLSNGELLDAADQDGYEVLVTTDSNLKFQRDLAQWRLGFVVLLSTSWPRMQQVIDLVVEAVDGATPGSYREIHVPDAGRAGG